MASAIGYCTNVHAGADLDQTLEQLARYAPEVRRHYSPDGTLGVGLWLSASSAERMEREGRIGQFADWLAAQGLSTLTLNGFPHGDFHQSVVKYRVYHPTWAEPERLDYTRRLVRLLDALLPPGEVGTISTLPIAWGSPEPAADQIGAAAAQLATLADELARLEADTGRLISICLEPEPGCYLQRSTDVVRLFEQHLLPAGSEAAIRRHIRVCHDCCHAAVMFESQADVLERYAGAGIAVGKYQISAAVHVPWDRMATTDQSLAALRQLRSLVEPRYLHQTVVAAQAGQSERFYEDLPLALDAAGNSKWLDRPWRIHFHVPIYVERFGDLESTQGEILECLAHIDPAECDAPLEVETYAWGVLPEELRQVDLAAGIAEELRWFDDVVERWRHGGLHPVRSM